MIFIDTQSRDANFHFALEEYLMKEHYFDDTVFLFWRTQPTVMLGKFQNLMVELNQANLAKDRVKITRRNTGGGTIYTDMGGFQYSFIIPGKSQEIDFKPYMDQVLASLRTLGIPAEYNSRNDLSLYGKKISGNAQCGIEGYTVHHGSLLYNTDLSKLPLYLNAPKYKIKSKGTQSVKDRTANIKNMTQKDWSEEEFKSAFLEVFLGEQVKLGQLTEEDYQAVHNLAQEKFESFSWVRGKNPAYTLSNTYLSDGGLIQARIDVNHDIIQSCHFSGDFFHNSNEGTIEGMEKELEGVVFDRQAVWDCLTHSPHKNALYRIGVEDILNSIFAHEEDFSN